MDTILLYFSIKYKGDWNRIFKALEDKEHVSLSEMRELEEKVKENNWRYITILDVNYPKKLKSSYKPPFVIWFKGNLELLQNNLLCISGDYLDKKVKEKVHKFIPEVNKNNRLVMGYFVGISDELIKSSPEIIHVCAQGIDKLDKNLYKENDLLISEYPYGTLAKKENFSNRNRLISCFAESLVLLNSKKDGGVNSLINSFLNQGKEIYCFPGSGDENDGNSELIKNGANLITSIKDISC